MPTQYPGAVDNFTNPTTADPMNSATVPHAAQHANVNDAVEAIETTLGTNPQGTSSTVKDRIIAAEGQIINLGLAVDERLPGEAGSNQPAGTPPNGYVWVNTGTNALKVWNGTQFVDPSNAGGSAAASGLVPITSQNFTAAGSVIVNNCFTSAYTNYRLMIFMTTAAGVQGFRLRLRAAGTDDSSANYSYQNTQSRAAAVTANTLTATTNFFLGAADTSGGWSAVDLFRPQVAANTFYNSLNGFTATAPYQSSISGAMNVSSAFDGFTLYPDSSTITGTVAVFGYKTA